MEGTGTRPPAWLNYGRSYPGTNRFCPAVQRFLVARDGPGARLDPALLGRLPDALRAAQGTFAQTGGLHAAGIFSLDGELLVCREDVGRHNAVDKAIGSLFRRGLLPLSRHVLLVSGRASFEIVQKALAAALPVVAAVSAPSSLAVDLARESGMTLVGFLRDGGFNVYSAEERLSLAAPARSERG